MEINELVLRSKNNPYIEAFFSVILNFFEYMLNTMSKIIKKTMATEKKFKRFPII